MDAAPYVIQVDPLYFQARENGVFFAISNNAVCSPKFHSHFGLRAKVGINLCHDQWQVFAQGMHFHARTRTTKSHSEFLPLWGHPLRISNGFALEIESLWRLHLGLIDFGLCRCFLLSHCLQTSFFWGLRYAEIRHKLYLEYSGGNLLESEDFSMKNKFWGIGPQVGLEILWQWNYWFGIFSRGVFSSPYGKVYVHQDEENGSERLKLFDRYDQLLAMVEGALGLDFRFCSSTFLFFARVGFEGYIFFRQNQLVRFVDSQSPGKFIANQGDLTLHGLSLGLGIEF